MRQGGFSTATVNVSVAAVNDNPVAADDAVLSVEDTALTISAASLLGNDGTNELVLRFESPEMGGVRLVKTYTLKRGAYVVDVRHEVINAGGQAVNPQLYVQLVRDGNKPAGESSFYSTFTGPAFYTEAKKFQKVDFSDIEKGKADFVTASPDGWVAMVQHYFASAWPSAAAACAAS